MQDTKKWPTKREAAELLNRSERSLDRMIANGEIEARERPVKGRTRPETVCNPEDIRAKMPQTKARVVSEPPPPDEASADEGAPVMPPEFLAAFLERMASIQPPGPPPIPRYLTLKEASAQTGLSRALLRRKIQDRSLPALRDRALKVLESDLATRLDLSAEMRLALPAPKETASAGGQ